MEQTIEDLKSEISALQATTKHLNKTIDAFNIPKHQNFDKTTLYQQNKILNVVGEKKPCQALLSFLTLQEIFCLGFSCKATKAFMFSHPSFLRIVTLNTYYDRINMNTTNLHGYVDSLRTEISQQDRTVISGVKRYLYYDYSVVDLIESLLDDSMAKIDKLKADLGSMRGSTVERKKAGSVMSFLKTALHIKDEKQPGGIKINKIKRIPLNLQEKVAEMMKSTPFEKFTLLDVANKKIEINNPKDYRATQNKLYREDIDKTSAEYITEFHSLLILMGNQE